MQVVATNFTLNAGGLQGGAMSLSSTGARNIAISRSNFWSNTVGACACDVGLAVVQSLRNVTAGACGATWLRPLEQHCVVCPPVFVVFPVCLTTVCGTPAANPAYP